MGKVFDGPAFFFLIEPVAIGLWLAIFAVGLMDKLPLMQKVPW
jgi:hypothetical protein